MRILAENLNVPVLGHWISTRFFWFQPEMLEKSHQSPLDPTHKPHFILLRKLMFPNPQHPPAVAPQCPRDQRIALFVSGKLSPPEGAVSLWLRAMLGAAMPKTTVHEDGEFEPWKNEVRLPEDFLMPPPAGDFVPAK
jgi:hypothetical protein